MARHAGVLLPLFSAPSSRSWGVGECADVPFVAEWLAEAGFDGWMLLPLGTMARGQSSPYSASSAMAIDPVFISLDVLEDFHHAGGRAALSVDARARLEQARSSPCIRYDDVRAVKTEALNLAFDAFWSRDWTASTPRAADLASYIARENWWLDDHAIFDAMSRGEHGAVWQRWPHEISTRAEGVINEVRRVLHREVLREQYIQWVAETQWHAARTAARERGVHLFGDLPFMVDINSADVWSRPQEFLDGCTAGAPPDAYSATGQDWGLPVYRWDVIAAGNFTWLRNRARRMAALYDGLRVDHVVGFYRTYARPLVGEPFFIPSEPEMQLTLGEAVVRIFLESGAKIMAEDLGTIPDFVRTSLLGLGVAGYRVMRWERKWDEPSHPFIDPASYPALSVATTGTHDTEPIAAWWDKAGEMDRTALLAVVAATNGHGDAAHREFDHEIRDKLLRSIFAAGSDEMLLPIQDIFGWRDRINVPGTVADANWTWRLPWQVDDMKNIDTCRERARYCRGLGRVKNA